MGVAREGLGRGERGRREWAEGKRAGRVRADAFDSKASKAPFLPIPFSLSLKLSQES